MPTKHASAVALEAFTEAALAAPPPSRRRVLPGLALLALPPHDPGVLNHAVEDDPGGVGVLPLRGLRWRLSRQVVPRPRPRHALAAGEGWDRTAGPQLGLSVRQPALEQAAKRLLRWDPRRPGSAGGAKDTWPLQVLRLPLGAGEVVCEVEESELLMRLHELGTNGRFSNAILPAQRAFLIIDITARRTGSTVDPG